jgi:predicted metal-dependent hydrolase
VKISPDRWKIILLSGWFKRPETLAAPAITVGEDIWPVRLVRHARSRRYRLVFDAARGELRLTMPQRGQADKALKWAAQQQEWIAGQTAKAQLPVSIDADSSFPYLGEMLSIQWDAAAPRAPVLGEGQLYIGGPQETVGPRAQRWLKAQALAVMTLESQVLARAAGLSLGRVSIGDPRSRWGSCTAEGDLRYSWRLIMAPSHVRRATVAHEVAHLRHMDHSPAFHAFVDELHDGDVSAARHWLRTHGRDLHRYRFDAR